MARLPNLSRLSLILLILLGLTGAGLWLSPSLTESKQLADDLPAAESAPETTSETGASERIASKTENSISKGMSKAEGLLKEEIAKDQQSTLAHLRAGRVFSLTEHGRLNRYRLALDELYDATLPVHERLCKIPKQADAGRLLSYAEAQAIRTGQWPGLVIYPEEGPPDAARRRVLTEQVLLKAKDLNAAGKAAADQGLKITNRPSYAPQHLVTAASSPLVALDAIAALSADANIQSVEPLLMRQRERKVFLNDSLLPDQWHLKNTGQAGGKVGVDIGIESVWDSYQGQGVRIAIVDDGLQINHPDLFPNVDTALNHYDWNDTPPDSDPSPNRLNDFHGTAVGGIVAARGNNNLGISGVAPQATLVGFRLIAGLVTDETEAESATRGSDIIQVKNNSWGISDGYPYELGATGALMAEAMKEAATSGRGGLGTVSVWSAGNGRHRGDQGNKDGFSNSMYGITVGAVTNKGILTFYSETGSHLCVVAPSAEMKAGIVTTDLAGVAGYNDGLNLKNLSEVDYTNDFNGTSAAAPVVSGVVALMLQANPRLNWRDVKEILLRSSTKISPKDTGWVERSGGDDRVPSLPPIKHHHSYGGGMINAPAAIQMAETWINLGPMVSNSLSQAPPAETARLNIRPSAGTTIILPLPEETKPSVKSTRIDVDFSNTEMRVESVTVKLSATHNRKGDLTLKLVSPSGTVSTLASYSRLDTGANYADWTFSSVRHWGESSRGIWSVVASEPIDDIDGALGTVTITLHGTSYPAIQLVQAPQIQLVAEGSSAAFSGSTTVSGKTTQHWLKNGKLIPDADTGSLLFPSVSFTDAGFYNYIARNLTREIDAPTALGVVRTAIPPQHVLPGRTAVFKVMAAGPALRYQWFIGSIPIRDDGRITGARTPTLTIRKITNTDANGYYCRVSLGDYSLNTQLANLRIMIPPELESFSPPVTGIVSGSVDYPIIADNGATSYTVTGLPPGLKLDSKTGRITGRPTKSGTYEVTVVASNAAGSSPYVSFFWEIEDLPEKTVGSHRGLVEHSAAYNDGYGGLFVLTVTKTGAFSGTLTRGKIRSSFKGALETLPATPYSTAAITIPRAAPATPLSLTFSLENGALEGSLGLGDDNDVRVWAQQQWTGLPGSLSALPGLYNVPLIPGVTNPVYPLGSGYLSTALTTKGVISYTGRLADGTAITGSAAPGLDGSLPLHHMLYSNIGSVQGTLTLVSSLPGFNAALDWVKSSQPVNSTSRSYRNGFPRHTLTGIGRLYTAPASNALVLNLPLTANNGRLDFSQGGLFIPFTQYFTLGAGNIPQFPIGSGNPHQLKLTLNAKTGLLTGSGTAMDIDPNNPSLLRQRSGTYSGLIIPGLNRSEGYFLLPENANATAPILSGRFIFQSSTTSN